jgi:tetratricopeptide (TPR) repeat protein
MPSPATSTPETRLDRLQRYLKTDPHNGVLLADAFDEALASGAWESASRLATLAEQQHLAQPAWQFRRARLCIALRDLQRAAELLEALQRTVGDSPVLAHDLAYVRLLQGDLAACRALLQPWIEDEDTPSGPNAALQVLWLRASHRLQLFGDALDWAQRRSAAGGLAPAALGVASLVALDASDFERAKQWSQASLQADRPVPEGLVTAAYVALAEGQTGHARSLLQRALALNRADGRTWSVLGLASLQARDLSLAQKQLETAVQYMPDHIGSWHALGWARLLQGARAPALEAFRHALALDRNFAESHGAVGLLLALDGQLSQAEHHLDAADRLDATNLTARYARALIAGDAGDAQAVQRLALRLLDRPGFFGGKLSDSFTRLADRPKSGA